MVIIKIIIILQFDELDVVGLMFYRGKTRSVRWSNLTTSDVFVDQHDGKGHCYLGMDREQKPLVEFRKVSQICLGTAATQHHTPGATDELCV